jgi:hypothetical protein
MVGAQILEPLQDRKLHEPGQLADSPLSGRGYPYFVVHQASVTQLRAQLVKTDGALALRLFDGSQRVVSV